jgi:D-tyrosyl-tRNA(Tyr) deacylase
MPAGHGFEADVIGLIQRVSEASVAVDGEVLGRIGPGLLALIGVQRGDDAPQAARLAERLLAYRVFEDTDGKMNLDLTQVNGGLLLIPQFTLAADTGRGNRPSFGRAAEPEAGRALFETLVESARSRWDTVETGRFGADMDISLVNRGPVTFWLEVPPARP